MKLPFSLGQAGQPVPPAAALQRSKYLSDAIDSLQSSSQDIRSPGELGSRLLANALLQWGKSRADKAAGDGAAVPTEVDFSGRTSFRSRPVGEGMSAPIAGPPAAAPPNLDFQPVRRPDRSAPSPFATIKKGF